MLNDTQYTTNKSGREPKKGEQTKRESDGEKEEEEYTPSYNNSGSSSSNAAVQ